jgi:ATP-dependent DNA helicase RecQ
LAAVATAASHASNPPTRDSAIAAVLQKYWGYDTLRPLQREAIDAGLAQRDSLVVLPTGGGKSLCYQIPPLLDERTDIVVSPLISLMKDQVDALRACGYPAAALYTGISDAERAQVIAGIAQGRYRLVFVAPERLLTGSFMSLVSRLNVKAFAIDEAHCISQWGHDFRPEYRRLAVLKERFPGASIHAFTATATPKVRQDIVEQLRLADPHVLVGNFDRPNLVYRIEQRERIDQQVLDTIRRHEREAVIVYCISRKETERMAAVLRESGVRAAAYHAGLDARERTRVQESFAAERTDVVVATVAFGMGIDRSNVRCVIHAAMPKSIEHYQQETGRAGRDGIEAECVLFHAASDYRSWEWLITQSAQEAEQPEAVTAAQLGLLSEMNRFCLSSQCRHAALVRYFGQTYEKQGCRACDICLSDRPQLEGGGEVARKVVSCVLGLGMAFGVSYVVEVLTGARTERIKNRRHDSLPEYGSLRELGRETVQDVVYQLVNQGVFERTDGDRPVLKPSRLARQVVQGSLTVSLQAPMRVATKRAPEQERPLTEDVRRLFELLRLERRAIADEQGVAPFIVFGDGTLYELARTRPTRLDTFAGVKGVGEQKLAQLGQRFIDVIAAYCRERGLPTNLGIASRAQTPSTNNSASRALAFKLFERGCSIDDVVSQTGRARSTVCSYLEDFVGETKPQSVDAWVDPHLYRRIETAAKQAGGAFLRPVFEALNSEVSYDDIRVVMKHAGLR